MLAAVLLLLLQDPAEEGRVILPPPPMVTLERGERSIGEILKSVRTQTGLKIDARKIDESRKVTVGWKNAPVLRALDELCRAMGAGDLRVGKEDIEIDGSAALPKAVGHGDRYRFIVHDVLVTTTRTLTGSKQEVSLALRVEGPPGTDISGASTEAVVDDAIDDKGWSLLTSEGVRRRSSDVPLEDLEEPNVVQFDRGHGWGRQGGTLNLQVEPPSREAKAIERLAGRTSLTFVMKKVDGKVPVADLVEGKEFRIGPMTVTVKGFEVKEGEATLAVACRAPGDDDGMSGFPDFTLLDADGKAVSRGASGTGNGDEYSYTYRLVKDAKVAALQYQASVGRMTKVVRFEIQNIPLPVKQ
jgi:hypothetical protein